MNKKRLKNVEKPAEDEKQTVDVSQFTIDDAFAYQNKQQMGLEEFINVVATKMKFKVSKIRNDGL